MSSLIGHSLTAVSVYTSKKELHEPSWRELVWLAGLAALAVAPDFDYLVPALRQTNHHGLRVTHSILGSLALPSCAILALAGLKLRPFWSYGLQALWAGLTHVLLDLLVGVTALPLLWPFSQRAFKLPFGLLPSAGSMRLGNYYFFHNLVIELGVLVPLYYGLYLARHAQRSRQQAVTVGVLWFCAACSMYWAYGLAR